MTMQRRLVLACKEVYGVRAVGDGLAMYMSMEVSVLYDECNYESNYESNYELSEQVCVCKGLLVN